MDSRCIAVAFPLVDSEGEVYQYIGDEIVITWPFNKGIRNANCLRCFFGMQSALMKREKYYADKYGFMPLFKAGIHCGMVTTGEIGALKKEIIFTGDILNTTARIQGLCNAYQSSLLVSARLFDQLPNRLEYEFKRLGEVDLRGKSAPVPLVSVSKRLAT